MFELDCCSLIQLGCVQGDVERTVADVAARGGPAHGGLSNQVGFFTQFVTLLHRMLLVSFRDIGVFWLRLGMYVGLCLALGTIYFQLTKSWSEATARGGLIFFTGACSAHRAGLQFVGWM